MRLRPKPFWLRWLTASYTWITLAPTVYYPAGIDPTRFPGVVAHENVHAERALAMGRLRWYWRYLTDPGFRFDEEVAGMAVELRTYSEPRRSLCLTSYAVDLAGSRYRNAAPSFAVAAGALREAVNAG